MRHYGATGFVHATVNDAPKLVACRGVVAERADGSGCHELRFAVDFKHGSGRERFLQIAIIGVRQPAILLPHRLAGDFVQARGVLFIVAIEEQKQPVFINDRRRRGAAPMIARQIVPRPQNLAALRVDAGGAARAEVRVDFPVVDYRRRRGVTIELADIRRVLVAEQV